MSKFKVGDEVFCINNRDHHNLQAGQVYVVASIPNSFNCIRLEHDDTIRYHEDRFELVQNQAITDFGPDHSPDIKPNRQPDSALDTQVGGTHYKNLVIQPIEFTHKNQLNYCQGNVVKYITRYKNKNGKADLEKAKHYIDLLIELEYGDK